MRLLWLPEVLRNAGLQVHEVSGWRSRGSDSFGPVRGITCHATAGARGGRAEDEIRVLLNGSPTAPPPIAQLYLARNGAYHVVASGTCFHNLVGWGGPNKGYGNDSLIGIEAGNDNRGEPWPSVQLNAYKRGVAAICEKMDIPAARVAGHYEHQPGDKSDPKGINMKEFRADVARLLVEGVEAMTEQEWDRLETLVKSAIDSRLDSVVQEGWRSAQTGSFEPGYKVDGSNALRESWAYGKENAAAIATLRGEVAGYAALVQQLANMPEVPLSPADVAALTTAVSEAASNAAKEAAESALERVRIDVQDS